MLEERHGPTLNIPKLFDSSASGTGGGGTRPVADVEGFGACAARAVGRCGLLLAAEFQVQWPAAKLDIFERCGLLVLPGTSRGLSLPEPWTTSKLETMSCRKADKGLSSMETSLPLLEPPPPPL